MIVGQLHKILVNLATKRNSAFAFLRAIRQNYDTSVELSRNARISIDRLMSGYPQNRTGGRLRSRTHAETARDLYGYRNRSGGVRKAVAQRRKTHK